MKGLALIALALTAVLWWAMLNSEGDAYRALESSGECC